VVHHLIAWLCTIFPHFLAAVNSGMMASAADREKIDNLFRSLMKLDPDDRNVTITPQQVDELRRKAAQGLLENDAPLASERLFRRIQIEGNDGATAQFLKTFGFDNTHIEALTNVDPAKTDKVVDAVNLITEKLHLAPA
jgi:hypothetical protein